MQYNSQPEQQIFFPAFGIESVVQQGQQIAIHIVRMNLILAEMYANEDTLVCEHCGSMDVLKYETQEEEYKLGSIPYWTINTDGSQWLASDWKERRDKTNTFASCNFCSHKVCLGFEWSDWYKIQCLEVSQPTFIVDPWNQKDAPPIWDISNGASYVVKDIWADNSNPKWNDHITVINYRTQVNTNGTRID